MHKLPTISSIDAAIFEYTHHSIQTDALRAHIVAALSKYKLPNRKIRALLGIEKVYTVTHLKRAGLELSTTEITLWHNNPSRISLGHIRALAHLPTTEREPILRNLLIHHIPVHKINCCLNKQPEEDPNVAQFAQIMSEQIGRPVRIEFNARQQKGCLSLDFYNLDDLETLTSALGFKSEEF